MENEFNLKAEELQGGTVRKIRKALIKRRTDHRIKLGDGKDMSIDMVRILNGRIAENTNLIDVLATKPDPTILPESDDPVEEDPTAP